MTTRHAIRFAPLLMGLLLPGGVLSAQVISARGLIAAPRSSVRFGDVVERLNGRWGGLELGIQLGRLTLSASGMRGELGPAASPPIQRVVGEVSVVGRYEVLSWLGAEAGYGARAVKSPAGYQRWDLLGLGARASRQLGVPGVRASAGLVYMPVAHVSQLDDPAFALRSDVGVSLTPETFPVTIELNYRIERFSFPKATDRSEQFEALTLAVGLGVRRQHGRWTLRGRK